MASSHARRPERPCTGAGRNDPAGRCVGHRPRVLASRSRLGQRVAVLPAPGNDPHPSRVDRSAGAELAGYRRSSCGSPAVIGATERERGFALVIVLWTMALLAIIGFAVLDAG